MSAALFCRSARRVTMEISDSGESEEDVSEDEAGDMNIAGTDAADATTTGTTASSSAASEEQERKKEQTRVIDWLLHCYAVLGKPGESIQKSDVYQSYLDECAVFSDILFTPTFFGKLVKRAFPGIKDMRKGPRGSAKQHYARLQRQTGDNPPEGAESREGDGQRAAPKPAAIVFRHYHPDRFAAAGQGDPHATGSSSTPVPQLRDPTGPEGGGGGASGSGSGGGGGGRRRAGGGKEEAGLTWVSVASGKKRKAASGERSRGGKQGRRSTEGAKKGESSTTTSEKGDSDDIGEQIRNLLLGEKGLPISALSTLVDDKGEIDLTLLPMLGRPATLPSDPSLSTSTSTTSSSSALSASSPNAPPGASSGAGGPAASPTGQSSVTSSSPELSRRGFLSSILRQRVGAKASAARSPSASTPPSSSVPSPQLTGSGETDTEMRTSTRQQHLPRSPPMPVGSLLPADQFSCPQPPTRSYQHPHHFPRAPHSQHQHSPYYFNPHHHHPHHPHHQPHYSHQAPAPPSSYYPSPSSHYPPPPPPPHYYGQHHHHHHPTEFGQHHPCPTCYQEEVMEEAHPTHLFIPPPPQQQQQQQAPPPSSSMPRSHSSPSLSSFAGESSYSHSSYNPSRSRFSRSASSGSSASMPAAGRYTPPPPPLSQQQQHQQPSHLSTYSLPPAPGFLPPPYSPPQGVPPQPMHAPIAPAPQRVRPQDYAQHPQHRSSPPLLFSTGDSLLGPAGEEDQLDPAGGFGVGGRRAGGRLYHSNPLPTNPHRYQHFMEAGGDHVGDGSMPSVPTPPSLSPTLALPTSRSGPPLPSGPPSQQSSGEQHFYGGHQQQQHHLFDQHQLQQSHAPLDYYDWEQFQGSSSEDNKYHQQGE